MKPQPYISPRFRPPTSPTWSLFGLLALAFAITALVLYVTSCAQLKSIPFSVSYQDDQGEVFTVTKGAVVTPQK